MAESPTTDRTAALQTLVSPGEVIRVREAGQASLSCQESIALAESAGTEADRADAPVTIRFRPVEPRRERPAVDPTAGTAVSSDDGDDAGFEFDPDARRLTVDLPVRSGPEAIVRVSRAFGRAEALLSTIEPGAIRVCLKAGDRVRSSMSPFARRQLYRSLGEHVERTEAVCHVHDRKAGEETPTDDDPLRDVADETLPVRDGAVAEAAGERPAGL